MPALLTAGGDYPPFKSANATGGLSVGGPYNECRTEKAQNLRYVPASEGISIHGGDEHLTHSGLETANSGGGMKTGLDHV